MIKFKEEYRPSDCRFCESPDPDTQRQLFLQNDISKFTLEKKNYVLESEQRIDHKNHSRLARPPTSEEAEIYYPLIYRLRKEQGFYPKDSNSEFLKSNLAFASLDIEDLNLKLVSSSNPEFLQNRKEFEEYIVVLGSLIHNFNNIVESGYIGSAILQNFLHKPNEHDRRKDTEAKVVEFVVRILLESINPENKIDFLRLIKEKKFREIYKYTNKLVGTLNIFTERRVCESCANVMHLFIKIFPGIKLVAIEGFGDYIKYDENSIKYKMTPSQMCDLRKHTIAGIPRPKQLALV
jgi:hypothetical protein